MVNQGEKVSTFVMKLLQFGRHLETFLQPMVVYMCKVGGCLILAQSRVMCSVHWTNWTKSTCVKLLFTKKGKFL